MVWKNAGESAWLTRLLCVGGRGRVRSMSSTTLQEIANAIVRRAQRQGFVLPREIRAQLTQAGLDEASWKEVVELAGPALRLRGGRYYHRDRAGDARREEDAPRGVKSAVREVLRRYRAVQVEERRE